MKKATSIYKEVANIWQRRIASTSNPNDISANQYGNLSWYQLHARQYPEAEQSARQGLALDSAQVWINTNLATALVLQGKYSQAETIYKALKDIPYEQDKSKTYREIFLEDLAALEKAGITHKDFVRVRKLLK